LKSASKTLSERLVRISKTSACTLLKLNFNSESTRLACTFFNTHARSSTRLACTLFNTAGMHALQHGWHARSSTRLACTLFNTAGTQAESITVRV